jgi:hypothetical protein
MEDNIPATRILFKNASDHGDYIIAHFLSCRQNIGRSDIPERDNKMRKYNSNFLTNYFSNFIYVLFCIVTFKRIDFSSIDEIGTKV